MSIRVHDWGRDRPIILLRSLETVAQRALSIVWNMKCRLLQIWRATVWRRRWRPDGNCRARRRGRGSPMNTVGNDSDGDFVDC